MWYLSFLSVCIAFRLHSDIDVHTYRPDDLPDQCREGQRVVSVGDLHGDWEHSIQLLQRLSIIDERGNWAGNDTIFIQTGDVVDRGDSGPELYDVLFRLQDQAPESGGQVILLMGNHELMAMQRDQRYVSPNEFMKWGGPIGHAKAWSMDGQLGNTTSGARARLQVAAKVNDVIYVHAGFLHKTLVNLAQQKTSDDAISTINEEFRQRIAAPSNILAFNPHTLFNEEDGPFWTRYLSLFENKESNVCADLNKTLTMLDANRMIVGHTAQEDGNVNTRCDGKFLLGDTFMSQAYTENSQVSDHNLAGIEYRGDSSCIGVIYPMRTREMSYKFLSQGMVRSSAEFSVNTELRQQRSVFQNIWDAFRGVSVH